MTGSQKSRRYRIFGIVLSCDFPLPELPPAAEGDAVLSVGLAGDGPPALDGFERVHEWAGPGAQAACWCERRAGEYLFVFPGFVRYLITADDRILCMPEPGCDRSVVRHFLLNQVIPRVLGTRGRLIVHASAVTLPGSGRTVAFLGHSGFGKSTLAASFHRHGAVLVSDDGILLAPGPDGISALGGLPGIRLLPDSVDALFSGAAGFEQSTPYTLKQQMMLQPTERYAQQPQPLAAVFLLNDPAGQPAPDEVRIEPLGGAEAMMALLQCLFCLDPSERGMMVHGFQATGRAVSERLPFFRLRYPRRHERLAEVRAAVVARVE